jgi:hypothetical protein
LECVGRWLASDGDGLGASLRRFVGADGYDVGELAGGLFGFAFVLGGGDEELVSGGGER